MSYPRFWLVIDDKNNTHYIYTRNEITVADELLKLDITRPIKYVFGFKAIKKAQERARRLERTMTRSLYGR